MLRLVLTAAVALTLLSSGTMAADTTTNTRNYSLADNAQHSGASLMLAQYYGGGNRVCCKRGYRDWWSTYRSCRRSGGYVVSNRFCRNDRFREGGFRDDRGYARVCCKRGYRDWWSTYGACRRSGGYVVSN